MIFPIKTATSLKLFFELSERSPVKLEQQTKEIYSLSR
jgi:hypothetical protein